MIWPRVLCLYESCEFMLCLIIWLTLVCIFLTGLRSSLLTMLLFQAIKDRNTGGEWDLRASWCIRWGPYSRARSSGPNYLFILKFYLNVAHFYVKDKYFIFIKPWIHVFIFKFLFNKRVIFMIMNQCCVLDNLWEIRVLHVVSEPTAILVLKFSQNTYNNYRGPTRYQVSVHIVFKICL